MCVCDGGRKCKHTDTKIVTAGVSDPGGIHLLLLSPPVSDPQESNFQGAEFTLQLSTENVYPEYNLFIIIFFYLCFSPIYCIEWESGKSVWGYE